MYHNRLILCHLILLFSFAVIEFDCHPLTGRSVNRNFSLESSEILESSDSDAAAEEAPFQVQIRRRFLFEDSFTCSGALIGPQTVLTAAHCTNR